MSFLDEIPFKFHDGFAPAAPAEDQSPATPDFHLPDCNEILMCTLHDFSMERKVLEWVDGVYGRSNPATDIRPSAPPYWMVLDGGGVSPAKSSPPQQGPDLPVRWCKSLSTSDLWLARPPRSSWGAPERAEQGGIFEEDGYSEDDEYSSSEESSAEVRQRLARARSTRASPQPLRAPRPRTSPCVPSPPSRCRHAQPDAAPQLCNVKKRKSLTPLNSTRSELEAANKRIAALVHPRKASPEGRGPHPNHHTRSSRNGSPLSPTPPPAASCCCCAKRPYSAGSIPPIRCHKPSTASLSPYSCLPPTRRGLPDSSGDVLLALSQEERDVIESVTSLGYPLRRAMIALQKMGEQSLEQVLGYLGATDRLCKMGYEEALVEEAMEMFQNSEIKAAEFLRLLLQFNDMGFQQEEIREVLLLYDNHRDRSLEELMIRAQ